MNPALNGIWEHMRDLGLGALAHANRHAGYGGPGCESWSDLSVLQAAHAAELLIKSRIAQEHPLLIFDQLPTPKAPLETPLDLEALFSKGKTLNWSALPARLWASTGFSLAAPSVFEKFGRLRNGIQHFAPAPSRDTGGETLRFIFSVIDPFINTCWGLFAIDYDEDDDPYIYLVSGLVDREVPFLVSPGAAQRFDDWDVDWSTVSPEYRRNMCDRVAAAKATLCMTKI